MAHLPIGVGGGSGSGSDDCTATLADVVAGKTAITSESDDEPAVGTLADKSGTTQSATPSLDATNSRLQMTIPATGKYSVASKLYAAYSAIANLIGLTAEKLWPGITILGITSSKSSMSGGTYTPKAAQQTIACAGKVVNSNIIIAGDSDLVAANIKKGVNIFGITGTWEGYVAAATDLYKYGANAAGFTCTSVYQAGYCNFETTYIEMDSGSDGANAVILTAGKSYNFAGYSKMKVQIKVIDQYVTYGNYREIRLAKSDGTDLVEYDCGAWDSNGTVYTAEFSLANLQTTFVPALEIANRSDVWQLQRVWIE